MTPDDKVPHYVHSIACDVNREDEADWSAPVRCTCGAQERWAARSSDEPEQDAA